MVGVPAQSFYLFFQQYYICRAATTGGMNGGHCCYIVTVIPRNFWLVVMRLVTVAEFLRMHWRPSESSTWANEIRIPWFFLSPSSEIKLLYRSGCSINTHRPKGGVCIPGFSESVLNGPTINFPTNISTILGVPSRFLPSPPNCGPDQQLERHPHPAQSKNHSAVD